MIRRVIPVVAVVVVAILAVVVGGATQAHAQTGAPATGNIKVVDGTNPGAVIVSFDAVPDSTHYRIGYVNMETDYLLAKASGTGEWIEAFIYADVDARNFAVDADGRTQYTLRRLEQGVRHAFTVRTTDGLQRKPTWPSNPRWRFHVVADRGAACPPAIIAAAVHPAEGVHELMLEGEGASQDDWDVRRSAPLQPFYENPSIGNDAGARPYPVVPIEGKSGSTDSLPVVVGSDDSAGRVSAQSEVPATGNIKVVDGTNPGEVIVSFDAVPDITHYRIGYVNMETDYPLAKASVTGEWIEAFIYVDVSVLNFAVDADETDALHSPATGTRCPPRLHRSHH